MRISKIDNIRKASNTDGLLYDNQTGCQTAVENIVEERIHAATENSVKLYSIFKKPKKEIQWQLELNNYVMNGCNGLFKPTCNFKNINKDKFKKALKEPFQDYIKFFISIIQGKPNSMTIARKLLLETVICEKKKLKAKILSKDKDNNLSKSIISQKCNYNINNSNIEFIDTVKNVQWQRLLGISPVGNVKDNMIEIFDILEKNLFDNISDCTYNDMCDALFSNKYNYHKNINDTYYDFWMGIAYDIFRNNFKKKKNDILNVKDVKRRVKGKLKTRITSKLLDFGKIIYHFTDESGNPIYDNYTITSFDLELIKAQETISQKVNNALMYSISNFAFAINSKVDFLFNDITYEPHHFKNYTKFFGGKSNFIEQYCNNHEPDNNGFTYLEQSKKLLSTIRNYHFHYENSKIQATPFDKIEELYKKECELQGNYIKQKYLSNDIDCYFNEQELDKLIVDIHKNTPTVPSAFIPSFRRLKKHFQSIPKYVEITKRLDEQQLLSLNFLLQNIYYCKFLSEPDYDSMCIKIDSIKKDNDNIKAYEDFKEEYGLTNDINTLSLKLQREYMQANSKKDNDKKHKQHYAILLRKLIAHGFWDYINKNYSNILNLADLYHQSKKLHPKDNKIKALEISALTTIYQKVLTDVEVTEKQILLGYYVIAKLLPPKELNDLKGDFLKYKQYYTDIYKRCKKVLCAPTAFILRENKTFALCDRIIAVLSVCAEGSGIISQKVGDYYTFDDNDENKEKNKDEYSKSLGWFLNPNVDSFNVLVNWQKQNITHNISIEDERDIWKKYVDDDKPIIFAQIERSRQNGTYNIIKQIYDLKIEKKDFDEMDRITKLPCYNSFHKSNYLLKNEVNEMYKYTFEKNKVELYNVSKLNDLIIDLYTNLVSWCYLWERDLEYIMLAFAYIGKNNLEEVKKVFTFKQKIRDIKGKKQGGSMGVKLLVYKDKYPTIAKLLNVYFLKDDNYYDINKRTKIRNQIAHWEYFRKSQRSHSLLEYYNYFLDILSYNPKLKNNVFEKFLKTLENHHIVQKTIEENKKLKQLKIFTFKNINPNQKNSKEYLYERVALNPNSIDSKKAKVKCYELLNSKAKNKENLFYIECEKDFPLFDENLLAPIEKLLEFKY